ncbi:glyoxalase [Neptunitalea chrysea]|uniref:Glyoxalase n=1 Tax=Neptunitalea chrysea TaxID=1647581 RepID=A0A9W6EVP3_9FLAO|nr:VOC family protein [Neptunitalea chrysea]GLB52732.1 glyoxalase [Neptunitalea chrysea]
MSAVSPKYSVPPNTTIGHVHLRVSDLKRSLAFYCDLLGFELIQLYGDEAAFVSAGGYHHHIGLNTWHSKDAEPDTREGVGLYHLAILYPTEKDLATILKRLRAANFPRIGASDHGVSKALYLRDPDNHGVELYWDRPEADWPKKSDGTLDMYTKPLDLEALLQLAD